MARTVEEGTEQLIIPSIGLFSIADYLDRNGFRVAIDNIGARVVADKSFELAKYIDTINARVCGISLHWLAHAHGAIHLAKLCKEKHPDSIIVLGGLTATIFHYEIISKYKFIDLVIRGEGEEPFLALMKSVDASRLSTGIPGSTWRSGDKIVVEPSAPSLKDLDEYEFTRIDLVQPRHWFFPTGGSPNVPYWQLPVSRGCSYNCATCGGSSYSYKRYLGRNRPTFRSPAKLVEDLRRLREQGIRAVFLFQDPRMGGRRYWEGLLGEFKREGIAVDHITMELFMPADEDYIRRISQLDVSVSLTISPESGSEEVRRRQGRYYSNESLFRTISICRKYDLPLLVFFMVALGYEDQMTIHETWRVWEKIHGVQRGLGGVGFGPMIVLDPGSRAFDDPRAHGYRIVYKNLEDHVKAFSLPSWHQWLNYETVKLDRRMVANLILDSLERLIHIREKYGIYDRTTAFRERFLVRLNRLILSEVDSAMSLDEGARGAKIAEIYERVKGYIDKLDSGERARARATAARGMRGCLKAARPPQAQQLLRVPVQYQLLLPVRYRRGPYRRQVVPDAF
jgi:B12-binding domain/radical SAM domain protein